MRQRWIWEVYMSLTVLSFKASSSVLSHFRDIGYLVVENVDNSFLLLDVKRDFITRQVFSRAIS